MSANPPGPAVAATDVARWTALRTLQRLSMFVALAAILGLWGVTANAQEPIQKIQDLVVQAQAAEAQGDVLRAIALYTEIQKIATESGFTSIANSIQPKLQALATGDTKTNKPNVNPKTSAPPNEPTATPSSDEYITGRIRFSTQMCSYGTCFPMSGTLDGDKSGYKLVLHDEGNYTVDIPRNGEANRTRPVSGGSLNQKYFVVMYANKILDLGIVGNMRYTYLNGLGCSPKSFKVNSSSEIRFSFILQKGCQLQVRGHNVGPKSAVSGCHKSTPPNEEVSLNFTELSCSLQ